MDIVWLISHNMNNKITKLPTPTAIILLRVLDMVGGLKIGRSLKLTLFYAQSPNLPKNWSDLVWISLKIWSEIGLNFNILSLNSKVGALPVLPKRSAKLTLGPQCVLFRYSGTHLVRIEPKKYTFSSSVTKLPIISICQMELSCF